MSEHSRKKKRVRFSLEPPIVHFLPREEAQQAWMSRHGPWVAAPRDDELWDGTTKAFRKRELTKQELRRVKFDNKVRTVLPSSVFWVYKKSRKKLPHELELKEIPNSSEVDDGRERVNSTTVPPEFIRDLNEYIEQNIEENLQAGLKPALKRDDDKSSKRTSRSRLSLRNLTRPAKGKDSSKRGDQPERRQSFLDWFMSPPSDDSEDEDLIEAIPFLESIERLDGLRNTNVKRSKAVETLWENLESNFASLTNFGQSVIWDVKTLLSMIWPETEI